jgi:hypothetical protein
MMASVVGWIIIGVLFCAISMALLWPIFRLMRQSRGQSKGFLWAYFIAIPICSLGLWYVIPFLVLGLFGRATH